MSAMTLVKPERAWPEHVVVRMLRRWAACQTLQEPPLPRLVALAAELDVAPEVAVAAGSFLQLTEACLGRPLVPDGGCSRALSADERAVLLLLAAAPAAGSVRTSAAVPHGLPGVLMWAAASLRLAVGGPGFEAEARHRAPGPQGPSCPFGLSAPVHR